MPEIDLEGRNLIYSVRVSKRAKRISLRFDSDGELELVYPLGKRLPTPEQVLRGKTEWVLAAGEKIRKARAKFPPPHYREGEIFPIRGVGHTLKLVRDPQQVGLRIRQDDGDLIVTFSCATGCPSAESLREAILRFYRDIAKAFLPQRVAELAGLYGFAFEKVRIKNQKTRWGSCSAKGNINLNMRLMMAPDGAIDYVILHELCHTRVMNHGVAFWNLVELNCPDYRRWKDWFKNQGAGLRL